MSKKTRGKVGRPEGPYGPYIDQKFKRTTYTVRLPKWILDRLRDSNILVGQYLTDLILNDTGWKPPKV